MLILLLLILHAVRQVVHLVEIADLEKLAKPKATQISVAKHFGVSRKTIQNVIANFYAESKLLNIAVKDVI